MCLIKVDRRRFGESLLGRLRLTKQEWHAVVDFLGGSHPFVDNHHHDADEYDGGGHSECRSVLGPLAVF